MDEPKIVAGIHCFEVLEALDDYVAGTLDDHVESQVDAHLAGCSACTTFGGRYAALVKALRSQLLVEVHPSTSTLARDLWQRSQRT